MKDMEERMEELHLMIVNLESTVMGPPPNRTNGIQGNLKKLSEEVDAAIKWANDIWNVRRREECLGIEECKKLERRLLERLEREDGTMIAKTNLKGVYLLGILQFVGTILVALIAAGVFKK